MEDEQNKQTEKKINWTKKPTWQEWIMFAVIVFALLLFWFYKVDIANLHAWYQGNCWCPLAEIGNSSLTFMP
jgi:hypothetical protein